MSRCAINNTAPDLAAELQKIYDSEINVRIGWFWDGGIEVRLGDDMNGYLAEETVMTVAEIVPWLQEAIAHFTLVNGIASKGVTRSCCGIGRCILVECRTPRFK